MTNNMFVSLYKPKGVSSFKVLSGLKKALNTSKVGHMGTLDPLAEGILPVAVGKYTKLIPYVNLLPKEYKVQVFFGLSTQTLDAEGVDLELLPEFDFDLSLTQIKSVIESFVGEIDQVPPKYSAIKIDGKRAYTLARNHQMDSLDIKARKVSLFSVSEFNLDGQILSFNLECGSGFYVRSLVRDIGEKLNVPCFMYSLERVRVGAFNLQNSSQLPEVSNLSLDQAIQNVVNLDVDSNQAKLIENGMPLDVNLDDGFYWVFYDQKELAFCSVNNNILTVIRRLC